MTLANGFEERNTPWAHSLHHYDAGVGLRSLDDVGALIAFFEARGGQLYGFRWKDWADFKSCAASGAGPAFDDQIIGTGDGVTRGFALQKAYRSGRAESISGSITKPVPGTVLAGIEGVPLVESIGFEVDVTTGIVTFTDAPDVGVTVTAGFEFDVPVRFDTDRIADLCLQFQGGVGADGAGAGGAAVTVRRALCASWDRGHDGVLVLGG